VKRWPLVLALHDAARAGDLGGVRAALAEGIEPNARAKGRKTALLHAAEHGQLLVVDYLASLGADIHCVTREGKTALHLAADHRRPEVVKWLLERGANPAARDVEGFSPLATMLRGCSASLDCFRLLFMATKDAPEPRGWTHAYALDRARDHVGHIGCRPPKEIVEMLLADAERVGAAAELEPDLRVRPERAPLDDRRDDWGR
jgi:hypothetical protein